MSKRFLRYLLVLGFLSISFGLFGVNEVYAQPICTTNADCLSDGWPPCFVCQTGNCVPDSTACDDGNLCTQDSCADNSSVGPLGCVHLPQLAAGATNLPTECYICEPTANGVVVDNGICDLAAGENCTANPTECGIVGFACGTPSPPLPAPGGPFPGAPTDYSTDCQVVTLYTDPDTQFETISCEDGDRCTSNLCTVPTNSDTVPGGPEPTCSNPPITACDPISDGCCPQGCEGPLFGAGATGSCNDPTGAPIPGCDPDCCAPEVCGNGDSEVQPPETCDDSVSSGEAGIKLNGQAVTDAECRDPGATDQCTYCGDGIFQPASEQCDVSAQALCPNEGVCTANCQCVTLAPCLQGSGCGNNSGKVQGDCDGWTPFAIGHPTAFQDYRELFAVGILGLAIVFIRSWIRKRAE